MDNYPMALSYSPQGGIDTTVYRYIAPRMAPKRKHNAGTLSSPPTPTKRTKTKATRRSNKKLCVCGAIQQEHCLIGGRGSHHSCNICVPYLLRTLPNLRTGAYLVCSDCHKDLDHASVKRVVEPKVYGQYLDAHLGLQQSCRTCFDTLPRIDFPDRITAACGHDGSTCRTCLARLLSVALDGKEWITPTCPECPAQLTLTDVKRFGTPAQVLTFDHRQLQQALRALPDYRACLAPNCGAGQIHLGGADNPVVTCGRCGGKSCFVHQIPWHSGRSCEEYDEWVQAGDRENQRKSLAWIKKECKTCPGCQRNIQKRGGCDHMTCGACRHEFCWVCFVPYNGPKGIFKLGNQAHRTDCSHYRANGLTVRGYFQLDAGLHM